MSEHRWLPLESNPDVMNKYVENLGVPGKWQFTDVFGLDVELLMMVPRPVAAVLLLYPLTDKAKATEIGSEEAGNKDMYFIKQTIGNACGTIGIIHSVLNNVERLELAGDKHLLKFLAATREMSPEERAQHLEEDSAFGAAHEDSAQEGQTEAPSLEDSVTGHFVAFVHNNGGLYEMDGRRSGPIRHGNTTPDTLIEDAALVIKQFIARDPDEMNFTVVALAQADDC